MDSGKLLLKKLLLCFLFRFSVSIDTISPIHSIKEGNIIVSSGNVFALGFFCPGNSRNHYIGIWYNQIPEQTVVWVANRDSPINDASGVLSINNQGNLVLHQGNQTVFPVWSTNVSIKTGSKNTVAQLLDSGNLVLFQDDTKRTLLWQSFDYPSNTDLPYMKLGLDLKTGFEWFLTSWKSRDDPGTGNYSYRIDPTGFPQLSLYRGSDRLWRAGTWTGRRWSGVPQMDQGYVIVNVSFVNNEDEVYVTWGITVPSIITRMIVNETGVQQRFTWDAKENRWIGFWSAPNELCDYYKHCGPNSICNTYPVDKSNSYECSCLPGYEPKLPEQWYLREGKSGCIKKRSNVSMCQSGEGFVKVAQVKIPDTSMASAQLNLGLKQCEKMCLGNCSCMAYATAYYEMDRGVGCLMWHGNLVDTRTYPDDGQDLYVRVDAVELAQYAKRKGPLDKNGILAILIVSVAAILFTFVVTCYLVRRKIKGTRRRKNYRSSSLFSKDSFKTNDFDENSSAELPFFDLRTIAAATNNFSPDNKLGEGGFGPVYKGVLFNGKEIAIKRLSKYSGQGIEEFKNEIMLIAKLQHRNLVRIIGCCIEEEEKMLIYEYLPNKSLDSFIFVETKKSLLDWRKRFEIICGIARGILYLHHDSRLRIIHRDLKASNILLDASMNPKISDFGMARIFGGDQIEGNTKRVVGTYGYMSPEYAMEGLFSIKSDVYSFGVLLLEIISGRKISSHYVDQSSTLNLIEHVWNLWKEGRAMEIVDPSLGEYSSSLADEVLRCIQIGLLCVQESAADRPTMSTVVSTLGNDKAVLPPPSQPAFVVKKAHNVDASGGTGSNNEVTLTLVQPR
ncbi:hypothetical protein SLE2022_014310 [Rubroshorea leprosula]